MQQDVQRAHRQLAVNEMQRVKRSVQNQRDDRDEDGEQAFMLANG
jgi:hypothetical protein